MTRDQASQWHREHKVQNTSHYGIQGWIPAASLHILVHSGKNAEIHRKLVADVCAPCASCCLCTMHAMHGCTISLMLRLNLLEQAFRDSSSRSTSEGWRMLQHQMYRSIQQPRYRPPTSIASSAPASSKGTPLACRCRLLVLHKSLWHLQYPAATAAQCAYGIETSV